MPRDIRPLKRIVFIAAVTVAVGHLAYAATAYIKNRSKTVRSIELAPEAPADEDARLKTFADRVVPVLNRRCGNCHGVLEAAYHPMQLEAENRTRLFWIADPSGRITTPEQIQIAYRQCTTERKEGSTLFKPIDHAAPPLASTLLRDPLAEMYSGAKHPEVFATPDDPDLQTMIEWVEMEIATKPEAHRPLETEAEKFFAENVVPIMVRKTCFGANCHGPLAFMDLKLEPGVPTLAERFTPDMHRANRLAMLGKNTRLVQLSGDIEQSKQLLKNIPVEQGGMVHKGGNNFFQKGDPDYEVLRRWLEIEKKAASRRMNAPLGEQRGIVFVRRPPGTPERFFEDDAFHPGGDLIWRVDGDETNLTAALHPDRPADVRAPTVSYDARRVAFAMRRSFDEPFNIWEIELASGAARQLTFSTDPKIHFLDPLYAPDPDDAKGNHLDRVCLVLVSNREGQWCASSPEGILGEAEEGTREVIVDQERTERAGTFDGRTIRFVRGTNTGQERVVRRHKPGRIVLDRPLDEPCDSTTHYVIDAEVRMAPKYDGYRMRLAEPGREAETFAATLTRMTYSVSQVRRPSMRSSGEVVFSALRTGWQDGRPLFNSALFRVHVDGSNFHIHNGSRSQVPIFADDRELPNGLEIRIGRDADSWWGGLLMLSDHQFGPTIEWNNPHDNLDHPYRAGEPSHSEHRFVPGWLSLDPAVTFGGVSPGGVYRDPYPLPDGSIMVSHAPGPIDLSDPEAAPNFDIVRLVPDPAFQSPDGYAPGKFRREVLVAGAASEVWARPVVVRQKEPVHKKLKLQKDLFGAPVKVRGFTGYPDGTPAVLKLFDLVLIESLFEQIVPVGGRHLHAEFCPTCGEVTPEIDQVKYARIIGAQPQHEGDTGPPRRFIIAEVPLEEDGSFYVELPSGVSWDMQSLNAERMALRWSNRWLYCLPGEKHTLSVPRQLYAQTCSGCHGSLSGSRFDTLRRPDVITSASRTLAVWDSKRHGKRLPANYSGTRPPQITAIDFKRDLQPILEAKCTGCHSGDQPDGDLNLAGSGAPDALLPFVEYREALAIESYLIEKLSGRELHSGRMLEGDTPHPAEHPLSHDELLQFIRWIDLGAMRHGGDQP